ncbi:MAG TPA: metallophosphoesterase family protein [Candidatus Thermoplasmatota archaeon]|nr:metallophosphoesterase family protein [Candidatus Thermoplasmatota archaeon]
MRTVALLLVVLVLALPPASAQAPALAPLVPEGVHVAYGSDPARTMTVMWHIRTSGAGQWTTSGLNLHVEYGTTAAYGLSAHAMPRPSPSLFSVAFVAFLHGLEPATEYHYRVGSENTGWTKSMTFRTAPLNATSFVVTAYGDQGVGRTATREPDAASPPARAVKAALDADPVLHLHPGDLSYGDWETWARHVEPLASRVPYMSALGNHDGDEERDLKEYIARMVMPSAPGAHYYAFTYGHARFVSLDTEAWCVQSISRGSGDHYGCTDQVNPAQLAFIEREFAAARADPDIRFLIPFFHKPMVSDGRHGGQARIVEAWGALFEKYRPEIVIQAHDHLYERSKPMVAGKGVDPHGSVYVVTGGGGRSLYDFRNATAPDWEAARAKEHHVVAMRFDGDVVNVTAIGLDGKILDAFTVPSLADHVSAGAGSPTRATPDIGFAWAALVAALAVALRARPRAR